jgi:hypothetical protein
MIATVENMERLRREQGEPICAKGVFVYSLATGERFSASPGDYWNHDPREPLTGRGQPDVPLPRVNPHPASPREGTPMTARDFRLIAATIAESVRTLDAGSIIVNAGAGEYRSVDVAAVERVLIAEFQRALATTNGRFDAERFAAAFAGSR